MNTTTKFIYTAFAAFALACLSPFAHATGLNPPPDGGYPGLTTAEGDNALFNLTSGFANTGLGWFSLFSDSTASYNTAVGAGALVLNNADSNTATGVAALLLNTTGTRNTANGTAALVYNDSGSDNTAMGAFALYNNTASNNCALGSYALFLNDSGGNNCAVGYNALASNVTTSFNTAIGSSALMHNTFGDYNTATGYVALNNNTDGPGNTATGAYALAQNTTGEANTATGVAALFINSTGAWNTAVGWNALNVSNGNRNTATGYKALINSTTGDDNTAVGYLALAFSGTGSGNIALGANAGNNVTTASNVICIGAAGQNANNSCYIGNIFGQTSFEGVGVFVNSDGKLGTSLSSRRFKKNIRTMDKASEAILALKPVTFHYKTDPKSTAQFGLIAEEVAEVNPDLIVRDKNGKPYSVRYDQVNAMLLNEFLKEHRKVEQLTKDFQSKLVEQQKQIEALTAGLRRVSVQIEMSKPVPQMVFNKP
jgi:trimeric autotransporter adhesin